MSEPIIPFSTGTQYMDWKEHNCMRCAKYPKDGEWGKCEIFDAILLSSVTIDGMSEQMAQRMNYDDDAYVWTCGEKEVKGEANADT